MKINYEEYTALSQLSQTDLAYLKHDPRLNSFYTYEPKLVNIQAVVGHRKKNPIDRNLLFEVLKAQYCSMGKSLPVEENALLDENTFTITTAHQPTLLTGPLFHIYKIASIIKLANECNQTFPDQKFIPVFVVSAEDHDWAEVNHLHLFGKRYEWERKAGGPIGHLSLEGLDALIVTISELFKNTPHGKKIEEILSSCLEKATSYAQFQSLLVSEIFDGTDLVVINLDDASFKRAFIPIMEKEIREKFSFRTVPVTQKEIEKAGFKVQAYCREINLFYMDEGIRERVDPDGEGVIRAETKVKYSIDEIIKELNQFPERFSPNVILRPLYEESILPNVAYVGGGGEIAYWLERKAQFAEANVHFPMLIRRNSLLMIDPSMQAQVSKLGLTYKDFFRDINTITKNYLLKTSASELQIDEELHLLKEAFQSLSKKADKVDPTLSKAIQAEESKQLKIFEQLGSRLLRTEKQHHDTQIKKLERIREKLFPGNGLQERYENFLSYYANYGADWIKDLIEVCDPFIEKFILAELPPLAQAQVPAQE